MAAYHPSAAAADFYYAAADFYGATEENVAPPTDAYLLPRALPLTVVLGKGKPNELHIPVAPATAAASVDAAFEEEMLLSILPQQQQQGPTTSISNSTCHACSHQRLDGIHRLWQFNRKYNQGKTLE